MSDFETIKEKPSDLLYPQPEIIKVLLIEDNPGDARLVKEMLIDAGANKFSLAHVGLIREGLALLKEEAYQVILLDLSLPDGHGLDNIRQVCAVAPHLPVVILTGLDDETIAIRAVQEGAEDYLVKGQMDSNLLVRAVRYAIERKRAKEALRESEERYRTIIESIQDNYFEVDLAGSLTFVNDAICRHLGYSREELIGMNYRQYTDPKTTKQVSQAYSELYRTGEPIKGLYGKVIRKNGTKLIHEVSVSLIRDSEGKPIGFRGISRDVTERKRMEDALRESENKFRSLVENSIVGVYLVQDGMFKYVNSRVANISGYKIEEMVDKMGPKQTALPEDLSIVEGNIGKRIKGEEESIHYEFRTVTKSREIRTVEVFGSRTMYQGRPAVIGTMLDITDRKKAEEALRQSEEKYRTILESIEEGYYEVDLPGNFCFFNDSFCQIHGYPREELTGMNYRQLTDQENANRVFQAFNRVHRTREPGREFDYWIIRKDGTMRCVQTSFSLQKDSSGKPIGYRGIVRDITERKRAEEALRQSEERARQLSQENAIMAEIGRIISSTLNVEEVYGRFADEVRKIIPFDRASVNTVNPDRTSITVAYAFGVKVGDIPVGAVLRLDDSLNESIITERSSLLIQPEDESELAKSHPNFVKHFRAGFRSMIATPLISQDQLIGILHIQSLKPKAYTESDVRLAERVGNQIAGAIANAQLFIERKRAEEALRQSEERYRTIIESIEEGYYEVDLAGNFTFLNDSMCRIWGYPKEELMGKNNRQYTEQESAKKVFQAFNRVYRTGESSRVIDYEIIRKDGTKRYIETSFSLIKDSSGKPMGFRGILRDITERKQMEEALQKSEERYRTILESIQEGYFEDDLSGNLTFFNDVLCRHFGYTREELIGMNFRQRVDEKDARKMRQFYSELYRTGEPIKALEAEFVRKDGTKLIGEFSASLIRNSEGKPIGFRGISRDITEKKKIEEQLFQAEKLRAVGEMASGVAHDFNNALAAILGNTQLLLYTTHDEELKETLKIVEKVAKDASQTVRRLQDFTRKRVDQELFRVDVNSIIKDSIEMTKPKWKDEPQSRGIRIEMVSNLEEIPSVSGSASELREVITNMIFNAIEAMPEGGKIEIRTFKERRDVFIQISDAGIGIAEEAKRKIFEPFFTTKPFTNAGLGLSMSYGIIKRFGGEIEVESKAGQGTTFTIILPMGGEEKEEPVSPQTIKKGRKARILVIDDDEFVRSVLSRTFAQANHQVTLAENGEKGVQLFKEGKFDIVLTDLGMPGMSGWEVCRTIKEISPHTPVGMITGWGEEKNRSKIEENGLDFFISKPFDFNQILNVIAETMESKEG